MRILTKHALWKCSSPEKEWLRTCFREVLLYIIKKIHFFLLALFHHLMRSLPHVRLFWDSPNSLDSEDVNLTHGYSFLFVASSFITWNCNSVFCNGLDAVKAAVKGFSLLRPTLTGRLYSVSTVAVCKIFPGQNASNLADLSAPPCFAEYHLQFTWQTDVDHSCYTYHATAKWHFSYLTNVFPRTLIFWFSCFT